MEEIIIDDVKVEECSYYNKDNTPYCCEIWDNECEAQNCYYKQLKRLEQENARLKEENEQLKKENKVNLSRSLDLNREIQNLSVENAELKAYKDVNEDFKTVWEELKAENERLKKENEILLCQLVINDGEDVTVQISESQFDKYNKYCQTLQEIKAICEMDCDCNFEECEEAKIDDILDLITKAEEE